MLRPFTKHAGIVLALVCFWKFLLLLTTAQPLPFSDAFFYDGAVVNLLNGGGYCNPSLDLVLPISATKVFSAYPPLYQFLLWIWMLGFGPSALAAMWLHFILFGVYCLALLAIFQQLKTSAVWVNFSCLFLFGITFHDRPDSLAFALGFWAIYAWLRALDNSSAVRPYWSWIAVGLNILTFATSLQLGILFIGWSGMVAMGMSRIREQRLPWVGLGLATMLPLLLGLYVKLMHPEIWAGFQEHVRETPVLRGLQASNHGDLMMSYIFKLIRYVPAVFLAAMGVGVVFVQQRLTLRNFFTSGNNVLLASALIVSGGLIVAITVFLVMVVHWILYFQVLIVAGVITLMQQVEVAPRHRRQFLGGFLLVFLIVGSRAIGMTTWGVINARDVNYAAARQRVHLALSELPTPATVVVSAAFLYEANTVSGLRSIHADWLASYRQPHDPIFSFLKLKPRQLILTQFDWYRSYEPVVTRLAQEQAWVEASVVNAAQVLPPDASRIFQKILQHTSWAPVVVDLRWKPDAPEVSTHQPSR